MPAIGALIVITVVIGGVALVGSGRTGGDQPGERRPVAGSSDQEAVRQIKPPAGGRTAPEATPTDPVAGEAVQITGRLTTSLARPVNLEALAGGQWRPVAEGTADADGSFSFSIAAPDAATAYRVRAPTFKTVEDREAVAHGRQTTRRVTVTPVRATASLAFAPAPVGQSAKGEAGLTSGQAQFSPARPGRDVVLQRRSDAGWEDVTKVGQDDRGVSAFHLRLGTTHATGTYRAVALAAGGAPALPSEPVQIADAPLVWNDEFDGAALDFGKWDYRQLGDRNPTGNRACAESNANAVRVADGHARFVVRRIPQSDERYDSKADCPHGQYFNGHIGTSGKFAFRYGVLAARMRFPGGQGKHSAFWSQPTTGGGGAEIDAVEYFGDDFPARPDPARGVAAGSHALQHSIYWTKSDGSLAKVGGLFDLRHLLFGERDWSEGFHVYSVEWTPEDYIFRVDGYETFRTSKGLSDTEQYLIISLLTSDWELPRLDVSQRAPLMVDWVRVWQPEA